MDRSLQATLPSSLATVTCRLFDELEAYLRASEFSAMTGNDFVHGAELSAREYTGTMEGMVMSRMWVGQYFDYTREHL